MRRVSGRQPTSLNPMMWTKIFAQNTKCHLIWTKESEMQKKQDFYTKYYLQIMTAESFFSPSFTETGFFVVVIGDKCIKRISLPA